MFGMSLGEVFFIFVIGIIVLGPDKLPGAIKSVAKLFNQLKAQTGEMQDVFNDLQNEAGKITSSVNEHITSFENLNDTTKTNYTKMIENKKQTKTTNKNKQKDKNKKTKKTKKNKTKKKYV